METVGRGKPTLATGVRHCGLFSLYPTRSLHTGMVGGEGKREGLYRRDHTTRKQGLKRGCVRGQQGWDSVLRAQNWPSPSNTALQACFPLAAPFLTTEPPITTSPQLESSSAPPSPVAPTSHQSPSPNGSATEGPRIYFLHPILFLLMYPQVLPFSLTSLYKH